MTLSCNGHHRMVTSIVTCVATGFMDTIFINSFISRSWFFSFLEEQHSCLVLDLD